MLPRLQVEATQRSTRDKAVDMEPPTITSRNTVVNRYKELMKLLTLPIPLRTLQIQPWLWE
jgi:hypothetical protein